MCSSVFEQNIPEVIIHGEILVKINEHQIVENFLLKILILKNLCRYSVDINKIKFF